MKLVSKFAGVALAICLGVAPAISADLNIPSPEGTWQSSGGETRFKVSMCGDGTQICAKLVWLRDDVRTPENLQYLNKYVVNAATPVRPNKWQGIVRYEGKTVEGSLTLVGVDTMKLSGCQFIACKSVQFERV